MIRRGFLEVDPTLLASILKKSESERAVLKSAMGDAWQRWSKETSIETPFLRAAVALTGESASLARARWWANVLRAGAKHREHTHDGRWAFVYHLTEGAAVRFESGESFAAIPGQLIVFESDLSHWTDEVVGDAPRVSISGNLYFRHS